MTGTRINGAYQKKFIGDLVWMLQFSVGKPAYDTGGHLPMCLDFLVRNDGIVSLADHKLQCFLFMFVKDTNCICSRYELHL
jgi:hypothetical protein